VEEFTSIAIWILITFLLINTIMFWFVNTTTYSENLSGISDITQHKGFTTEDLDELKLNIFGIGIDCSTVSAFDLAFAPCFLTRALMVFDNFVKMIWDFLTGWINLINQIIPEWIPGSDLFRMLIIPLLAAIQFMAFFVVILKVAGIVRGGS